MSLDIQGLVANGVDMAFTQLGQLVKQTSFKRLSNVAYDTSTGEVAATEEEMIIGCIFLDSEQADGRFAYSGEIQGDAVEVGDRKLLLKAKDLVFELSKDLVVTKIVDSSKWSIVNYKVDPTESLYEVHIRRAG